jgi:hypothetical protein
MTTRSAETPEEYLESLPPETIARVPIDQYLVHYEAARRSSRKARAG